MSRTKSFDKWKSVSPALKLYFKEYGNPSLLFFTKYESPLLPPVHKLLFASNANELLLTLAVLEWNKYLSFDLLYST